MKLDLIEKGGAWFTVGETRIQGRDNVKLYLKAIADEIEEKIRANSFKLMSPQQKIALKAAGRAVDVDADDFEG